MGFFWHHGKIIGIAVQSDSEKYKFCGWFPRLSGTDNLIPQMEMADELIQDYKAGRKTLVNIDLYSQNIKSNGNYF